MFIICDARLPEMIKLNLSKMGEVVEFSSQGVVYEAISGHPDIFFHKVGDVLIHAPNTPAKLLKILESKHINLVVGNKPLGKRYPETVFYNAVADEKRLYCHSSYIDLAVKNAHSVREIFHLNQGYAACNIVVGSRSILSSDKGICKLTGATYFDPKEILLQGVNHGFIGGSCSVFQDMLLLNGSMEYVFNSEIIRNFSKDNNLKIIELYSGPLVDGGGLLFLQD